MALFYSVTHAYLRYNYCLFCHLRAGVFHVMPIVVASCTARKRGSKDAVTITPDMMGLTLGDTVENWRKAVALRVAERSAGDLYSGRSVTEVHRAVGLSKSQLFFVSAGMGLVAAQDKIPAYDISPAKPNGGLAAALSHHQSSPADWWSCVSSNGLSRLIRQHKDQQILVALPSTYLKMVALDLARVNPGDLERLSIFTSHFGASEVPEFLRSTVMPYDDRLESVSEYAGTRADFPQRALRHFVQELRGPHETSRESRLRVEQSLVGYGLREVPVRQRLGDAQVKALIRGRWKSCQGHSSRLLRALRDEELVACEQGRFANLWREVRDELARKAATGARR